MIVPNAVIPNWKKEFKRWAPELETVIYHGRKDHREKVFNQFLKTEVDGRQKFNVCLTTYEYIIRYEHWLCDA